MLFSTLEWLVALDGYGNDNTVHTSFILDCKQNKLIEY